MNLKILCLTTKHLIRFGQSQSIVKNQQIIKKLLKMLTCLRYFTTLIYTLQHISQKTEKKPTVFLVLRGRIHPVVLVGQGDQLKLLDHQGDRPCVRHKAEIRTYFAEAFEGK